MANQSEKYIKSLGGGRANTTIPMNTPKEYKDRQREVYGLKTRDYVKDRAKYSNDYVLAEVQGLIPDDFFEYVSTYIRLSNVVSQTASSPRNTDDYKLILFQEPAIDYFPIGAKLKTMGNTWICTNPSNLSSTHTTAIVQRCNASYNLYDWYGNIVTEPIIVESVSMSSNNDSVAENIVEMNGYFNATCQLNENTRNLDQNRKILLGSKAYHITGFTDFIQEFSGDYDSVHILKYTLRIEEPTTNDDIENHIANGLNYSFEAAISGNDEITIDGTTTLTAHFIKNGAEAEATEDNPITWVWASSDAEIATVSDDGVVTGIVAGSVVITATMAQNASVTASYEITVTEEEEITGVLFVGTVAKEIAQYASVTLTAGYYENGELTEEEITWEISGAPVSTYTVETDGNSITITCLGYSITPLTVTAEHGEDAVSTEIKLRGY